jgi:hypothetical protein
MTQIVGLANSRSILETRGEIVCFEVFKGDPTVIQALFLKADYCFLLAPVYAISGVDLGKQRLKYNCACTIRQLVDVYIKKSNSHIFTRKEPYPVKNREYQDLSLGYCPLSGVEMEEFKKLLHTRNLERFNLSFA